MGLLINGVWLDDSYDASASSEAIMRSNENLRNWVTSDGCAGPTGKRGFKAESQRYHLYTSLACPEAHRTLLMHQLKGLNEHVSISTVGQDLLEHGWTFNRDMGSSGDNLFNFDYLHQIYTAHSPSYSGRANVPVLWDKEQQCIVSNNADDIMLMFNSAFNHTTDNYEDYNPLQGKSIIGKFNTFIDENIHKNILSCGFADNQSEYDMSCHKLFLALSYLDKLLSHKRYLVGDRITIADWRLFSLLIRFDAVYYSLFKCSHQRLDEYLHVSNYIRELYQWPCIAKTVNFTSIKYFYYLSYTSLNPSRIVPPGPKINYKLPHNRSDFTKNLVA